MSKKEVLCTSIKKESPNLRLLTLAQNSPSSDLFKAVSAFLELYQHMSLRCSLSLTSLLLNDAISIYVAVPEILSFNFEGGIKLAKYIIWTFFSCYVSLWPFALSFFANALSSSR